MESILIDSPLDPVTRRSFHRRPARCAPEAFGLTIVEAMACGRAVISGASGGAAELLTPGGDAIAVKPADQDSLADAIARLSRDPQLRESLGSRGRATAVARFGRD